MSFMDIMTKILNKMKTSDTVKVYLVEEKKGQEIANHRVHPERQVEC